jgi:hypothetical protein
MKLFDTEYRIVTDKYSGYQAQYRLWWWPLWLECSRNGGWGVNTNASAFLAKKLIDQHKAKRATPTIVVWQE